MKLISPTPDKPELYDLADDPMETRNLADQRPLDRDWRTCRGGALLLVAACAHYVAAPLPRDLRARPPAADELEMMRIGLCPVTHGFRQAGNQCVASGTPESCGSSGRGIEASGGHPTAHRSSTGARMDNLTLVRSAPGVEPADEVAGRVRLLIGQIRVSIGSSARSYNSGVLWRRLNQLQIVALIARSRRAS